MKCAGISLISGLLLSSIAMAQSVGSMGRIDVTTNIPANTWTQGQQRSAASDCSRCCLYENRTYSEGAVIKTEGALLQCIRDKKTLSTQNLIWQVVK